MQEPSTELHGNKAAKTTKGRYLGIVQSGGRFSLVNDLASKNPDKLKEFQDLFMKEAEKNYALPIDDRLFERLHLKLWVVRLF